MFDGVNFDYRGARVLVTGGSNGIGRAIAEAYREAGADVVVTGRRKSAADYEHDLQGFTYRQLDVADKDQIDAVVAGLERLDILINNVGGHQSVRDSEWDPEGFDGAFAVNLSSVFRLSHAAFPQLKASDFSGGASIVCLSSSAAYFGYEPAPGYSAAKAGMIQLVKTLAVAWAAHGIRANGVAPGCVETNLTEPYRDTIAAKIEDTPLRRIGQPRDIAAAVLFLTSPAASWITGQTLVADGGFTVAK